MSRSVLIRLWNRSAAGLVLTTASFSLMSVGCWADFPESRLTDSAALDTRLADTRAKDGPRAEGIKRDGPVADQVIDGQASDGPTADAPPVDGEIHDAVGQDASPQDARMDGPGMDTLRPDTLGPDTLRPDTLRPDTLRPDTLRPDGPFSCTPLAFRRCGSQSMLIRCDASGAAEESVNCAPFDCNASAGRCNECTPLARTCDKAREVTCSADGLESRRVCKLGCASGFCCVDKDKDTYSDCDGDCNENNSSVFPDQTAWFEDELPTGGFDYNCSGTEEKEYPKVVNCRVSGTRCLGHGWRDEVAKCGEQATFHNCKYNAGACDINVRLRVQRCL